MNDPSLDIVVSYVSTDKRWGEWIAYVLQNQHYRAEAVESALTHYPTVSAEIMLGLRRVMPVLSSVSMNSPEAAEWHTLGYADLPWKQGRMVVPVLVEGHEFPAPLGVLSPIDLRGFSAMNTDAAASFLLESMIREANPPFPGSR